MKKIPVIILILFLAVVVRFYNFENRITFGPEQAISLLVSADYINEKFSLLGLPSTQRTTSFGHIIYYPAVFNYSLIPLLLITNYNALIITGFFALLNILTGLLIYFLAKKISNEKTALFSSIIFLFSDYMIHHSLFIWSVNYLPLLSVIIFFLIARAYQRKPVKLTALWIGLLAGLSFGVEYIYLFSGMLIFSLTVHFAKNRLISSCLFLAGAALSILPTIIFDLTHDFYHFKTLWRYLLDTMAIPGQSKITYYHFLHFWPLLAIIGGAGLYIVSKKSTITAWILLLIYITVNLASPKVSFQNPIGMYKDLNYPVFKSAAQSIASNSPENFNVVTTFDFDSRAHPLRYLLKYNHNLTPQGVEDYPNSESLYILTTPNYQVLTTSLWEISSFRPDKTETLNNLTHFSVIKLTHTE